MQLHIMGIAYYVICNMKHRLTIVPNAINLTLKFPDERFSRKVLWKLTE